MPISPAPAVVEANENYFFTFTTALKTAWQFLKATEQLTDKNNKNTNILRH